MKQVTRILGVIALAVVLAWPAKASEIKAQIGEVKYNQAVANLLVGLKSDNAGLKRSAAYMLGQFEAGEAVIPLMAVLRSANDEIGRVAAAWALCKIGDARGVYAVRQAARFDGSPKVRSLCAWYYSVYVDNGAFSFSPEVGASAALTSR